KLGIVMRCREPRVALRFRRVAPDVDERVLRADAQLRVALLGNPVADVRDPVPRVDRGRPPGKACGQRVALSGLRRVDPQLVESRGRLLRIAPADTAQS